MTYIKLPKTEVRSMLKKAQAASHQEGFNIEEYLKPIESGRDFIRVYIKTTDQKVLSMDPSQCAILFIRKEDKSIVRNLAFTDKTEDVYRIVKDLESAFDSMYEAEALYKPIIEALPDIRIRASNKNAHKLKIAAQSLEFMLETVKSIIEEVTDND